MRTKFTTTIEEERLKDLDYIKYVEGFKNRNDVIEYLIEKWGELNNDKNTNKRSESRKIKEYSK